MITPEFTELAAAVNNWGRWGAEDERGTLNLITDETVRAAAACVTSGRRLSLALPLSEDGPQIGIIPGRINPVRTTIADFEGMDDDEAGVRFNDDAVSMGVQSATHLDALSHASYSGRLYNGFPTSSITAATGATRLGIEKVGAIVGRGVLLDLAAAAGVDRLPGGHALTAADLEQAEEFGKVTVEEGDVVLLRTGQIKFLDEGDKLSYVISSPGPSMQTVRWFHDRGAALVATDTLTYEVYPCEVEGLNLPVHMLHLVEMGLTQGQNFNLEELSAACADDGRYAFLIDATPEPIVGAAGAPVVPIVVK